MAACNISGIKCILCADPVLPTDETTELGTVIVSLNQKANQGIKNIYKFKNKNIFKVRKSKSTLTTSISQNLGQPVFSTYSHKLLQTHISYIYTLFYFTV